MNAKLTKGLAAAAISAAMMLGAAVPALATPNYGTGDQPEAYLNKSYTATGDGATAPSEAFRLTALTATNPAAESFGALPTVNTTSEINTTTQNYFVITLPNYDKVGEYTYTFSEQVPTKKTAGVTYDTEEYQLKVTVINEVTTNENGQEIPTGKLIRKVAVRKSSDKTTDPETKVKEIKNTYKANTLTVGKKVEGILGDTSKEFTLTVTFDAPKDTAWTNAIDATPNDAQKASVTENGDTYTVKVKDGGKVTFKNVPDNAEYTVTEVEAGQDNYTTTGEVKKAEVLDKNETVTVINSKGGDVDTGVLLNNAPYVAIIGGAAVVAIYVVNKRRHSDMD